MKVSSVKCIDDNWQCVISYRLVEVLYYEEILPLLYSSVETESLQVLLEFSDANESVKHCANELLISFSLDSRHSFGDKSEYEFVRKMHEDISQYSQDNPAAVTYYIVSDASVTMCVPCVNPKTIKRYIENKLNAAKVKKFLIKIIDRRSGAIQM